MSGYEDLARGDILDGKYVIEALIGRGGMGAVYRARHVDLGSRRAIKVMRRELAQDASFVRRFRNEPRLAEGVRHPNVVAVYDFSTLEDGTSYIVWEYVEGDTLAKLLAQGPVFTDQEVIHVLQQVADGLAAAHDKGILHRDVSPDNIMVCTDARGDKNVKLLDFGLAKGGGIPEETPADASMLFGKIGYASPEQMGLLRDDERLDSRTDVFSLAAVAYTMLAGESPFRTSSLQAFVHDLMIAPEEEVRDRFLENLPPRWHTPISQALSRDRNARPETTKSFVAGVKEAASQIAEKAPIPQAEAVRPRWRALLYASAVGIAILGVTVTVREVNRSPVPVPEAAATQTRTGLERTRGQQTPFREEIPDRPASSPQSSETPDSPESDDATTAPDEETSRRVATAQTETSPRGEPATRQPGNARDSEGNALEESDGNLETDRGPAEELGVGFESAAVLYREPTLETTTARDDSGDEPSASSQPPPPVPPDPRPATSATPPRLVFQKEPVYTAIARRLKIEGDVILKAVISRQGDVTDVEVVRSIPQLDTAAIEAARQWKFEPARVDGVAVPREMQLTVKFRLTP